MLIIMPTRRRTLESPSSSFLAFLPFNRDGEDLGKPLRQMPTPTVRTDCAAIDFRESSLAASMYKWFTAEQAVATMAVIQDCRDSLSCGVIRAPKVKPLPFTSRHVLAIHLAHSLGLLSAATAMSKPTLRPLGGAIVG